MKRNLRAVKHLLLCVCLLLSATALTHAKAWRGIVPLHSTRADVRRRLGKPNPRSKGHELKTERADIIYSAGSPCAKGSEGIWNVPPGTVVRIFVTPGGKRSKKLWLSDLKLDMQKYKRVKDPEVEVYTYYENEEEGIKYLVLEEGGKESSGRVLKIEYGPSAKDKHLLCPAPVARTN